MAKLTAVVFDIGNVLVNWNPRWLYEKRIADKEKLEYFLKEVLKPEWNLEQDRGRPFAEGVALLSEEFPDYADMIALFDSHWLETLSGVIAGSAGILNQLVAGGVPVFGLTNFSAEKWPLFCADYDFTTQFDDVLVSGEEGLVKPDPEIYKLAMNRFGLVPENTIFIDDKPDNVAAAEQLGIVGHHFTDAPQLYAVLQKHGLLI
ncbi:MAG: HAD family phosphatase [Kordiimonadaceae bacterium]|nr:HAD family phosphatase [Kordiimonadaceae bacterium]